jgi:hypothetical protein
MPAMTARLKTSHRGYIGRAEKDLKRTEVITAKAQRKQRPGPLGERRRQQQCVFYWGRVVARAAAHYFEFVTGVETERRQI